MCVVTTPLSLELVKQFRTQYRNGGSAAVFALGYFQAARRFINVKFGYVASRHVTACGVISCRVMSVRGR